SDKEIEGVVNFIKKQGEVKYDDSVMEEIDRCVRESDTKGKKGSSASSDGDSDEDSMLDAAIDVVVECGQASTSLLQRRLKLGYARAARIVDQMEERGIVGPSQGSKPREVRITKTQLYEMRMRQDAAAESVDQIHSENTEI
ncbi:MAG: DNA translocase FtsK, partial [Clostridia bacterium]|nr:DNA translocase FtsK [Clostridia bacterium]